MSAWSAPFGAPRAGGGLRTDEVVIAEGFVERRLHLGLGRGLAVWEETGESIARHIWYLIHAPLFSIIIISKQLVSPICALPKGALESLNPYDTGMAVSR